MIRHTPRSTMGIGAAVILGLTLPAPAANLTYTGTGDWETAANWGGAVPTSADTAVIDGDANVTFDAGTWTYLGDNSLLNSPTEYRVQLIRVANAGTDAITFDFGDGNTARTTNSALTYIGSGNGANGTVNLHSGTLFVESNTIAIGEKAGSTGLLNITGGTYVAGRESGGNSLNLGTGGAGTLRIAGGTLRTRAGVTVGAAGTFDVRGSGVSEIGIGSYNSVDGRWVQNAGGVLSLGVDAGGITPIFIDDVNDDGGGTQSNVVFASGAVLDPYDLGGAAANVWHTVMTWEGTLTDSGVALSPAAAASGWSFRVEGSSLQVMLVPEPASLVLVGVGAAIVLARRR